MADTGHGAEPDDIYDWLGRSAQDAWGVRHLVLIAGLMVAGSRQAPDWLFRVAILRLVDHCGRPRTVDRDRVRPALGRDERLRDNRDFPTS